MGNSFEHGESPEILLQGYENSPLLEGNGQNRFFARVMFPIAAPNNVMPSRLKRIPRLDRETRVEKNLQGAPSMESG
jgi:hypothetical protein